MREIKRRPINSSISTRRGEMTFMEWSPLTFAHSSGIDSDCSSTRQLENRRRLEARLAEQCRDKGSSEPLSEQTCRRLTWRSRTQSNSDFPMHSPMGRRELTIAQVVELINQRINISK